MPVRRLIDRASYPPEALAVIFDAFDQAWAELANDFETDDPAGQELARNRLAQAVLAIATPNASNVGELKAEALAAFEKMNRGGRP